MTHRWLAAMTITVIALAVAACGSGTSTAPANPPLSATASAQLAGLRDQCVGMDGVFLVDRSPAASHQTPYGCRYIGLDGRTSVNFVGTEDGNYGYVDTMPTTSAVPALRAINQAGTACTAAKGTFASVGDSSNSSYGCTTASGNVDLLVIATDARWSWQTPLGP